MVKNKIIAIDLGGTNLRIALIENRKIKEIIRKKTPKNKENLLKEICESISYFYNREKDTKGIGIASPGPLDSKKGIIRNTPNISLKNFNLKKYLEKKFKIPVKIENDVNCVAIAELKKGCKKNNFFILSFGTGIGGGIIINGKLYSGQGFAGELGHITLDNHKSFETVWKEKFKETEKFFGRKLNISELLKSKDKKAKKILDEITDYIGQGISSLIVIFDPEIVILAGGVKETGNKYLRMIKKSTYKYCTLPKKTEISWSKLKEPGIIGAGLLME